jgi:hypothetical protein
MDRRNSWIGSSLVEEAPLAMAGAGAADLVSIFIMSLYIVAKTAPPRSAAPPLEILQSWHLSCMFEPNSLLSGSFPKILILADKFRLANQRWLG